MNTKSDLTFFSSTTLVGCTYIVMILYFGLTIIEEEGREDNMQNFNNILIPIGVFAQEENKPPVIKNLKIINFSGFNYADVVNSRDINLNSFTVSTWFNTNMNVTGRDLLF
jgi:hypothetical protein